MNFRKWVAYEFQHKQKKSNFFGRAFCVDTISVVIRMCYHCKLVCKFTFHSKVKKKKKTTTKPEKNEIRSHNENKNRTAFTNTEWIFIAHSFCFPQKTPYQRLISRNSMNVICLMWIHIGVPLSPVNTIRYFMYMIPILECIFVCFYFILSYRVIIIKSNDMS